MNWFKKDKIEVVRKVSFFEFIKPKYVILKIIPDSSVRNYRTDDLIKTIADQYKIPLERFTYKGLRITGYQVQERAAWEISIEKEKIVFYLHIPEHLKDLYIRRIGSIWDKATIEEQENTNEVNSDLVTAYELVYKKHEIFSINTDSKENTPLKSILEASRLVRDDEKAKVFIYMDPFHQESWFHSKEEAWNKLREGERLRKRQYDLSEALFTLGKVASTVISETIFAISDFLSDGKEENVYKKTSKVDLDMIKYQLDNLKPATRRKKQQNGINAGIWAICEGKDEQHRDIVAKTIANSFFDVADDNELTPKLLNKKKTKEVCKVIQTKEAPQIKITFNAMSTDEVGKLIQLPGRELQESFPEIEKLSILETQTTASELLDEKGMYLGDTVYKGHKQTVYQPSNSFDELCLPTVTIGGMGQGKTKGFLANKAVEAVKQGFGCIVIDPAKKEIGDEIEKVLPPEKVERFNLGEMVFSLDWSEVLHDERSKAKLAGTVVSFFGIDEDTTGQTERYLRAAVMSMKTGKVSEIINIFENEKALDEAINSFEHDDDLNKITLKQFKKQTGMRNQILSPIYNRLNYILSDPHLSNCIRSDNKLDMVEIMTKKKAIIFDLPAADLDKTATDIIVNLLSSKIDLAMRMRAKVKGPQAEFPFFILMDEPHQYLRGSKIWESATVESRKWRVGYTWAFHYWEQIPTKLQLAIRNALPHYHLYPSSKKTFESLREEIYPFTVEEALKLKRWHAINIIRASGENIQPFIAKMAAPPSERRAMST